jgi:hypothetical protein
MKQLSEERESQLRDTEALLLRKGRMNHLRLAIRLAIERLRADRATETAVCALREVRRAFQQKLTPLKRQLAQLQRDVGTKEVQNGDLALRLADLARAAEMKAGEIPTLTEKVMLLQQALNVALNRCVDEGQVQKESRFIRHLVLIVMVGALGYICGLASGPVPFCSVDSRRVTA